MKNELAFLICIILCAQPFSCVSHFLSLSLPLSIYIYLAILSLYIYIIVSLSLSFPLMDNYIVLIPSSVLMEPCREITKRYKYLSVI